MTLWLDRRIWRHSDWLGVWAGPTHADCCGVPPMWYCAQKGGVDWTRIHAYFAAWIVHRIRSAARVSCPSPDSARKAALLQNSAAPHFTVFVASL